MDKGNDLVAVEDWTRPLTNITPHKEQAEMFEMEIDRKAPCVSHRRNHGPCRTRWPWNAFSFSITVVDFRERRQQAAGRQAILGQHLQILLDTVGEADVDHARIADAMSAATVAVCAALRSCPSMRAAGYHG